MKQELLTTNEAIEILRITRPTLLKLIKDGKLKATKIGHNYRILKEDLDSFIRGESDEPKAAAR
jgi:excisionase family DNA binding protein